MEEKPRNDNEKQLVEKKTYADTIHKLGADGFATFGGFYYKNDNSRASSLGTVITVNEKFINISEDERERVSYHEVQHTINSHRFCELETGENTALFAFVLYPRFKDLHERMEQFYNYHRQNGYPFAKTVGPIPTKYAELRDSSADYTNPDELLALLRGYQCYLEQKETGTNIRTEPYEFIEAFLPEDLEFLDEQVRFKLATEVIAKDPNALKPTTFPPLVWKQ